MISNLIFAMTLAFGKQKLGDVFQRKWMILKTIHVTHFLQFVTAQSLIARKDCLEIIVQTKTKAVKPMKAMVWKILSSAMIVKPAYQMVTIVLTFIQIKNSRNFLNSRKEMWWNFSLFVWWRWKVWRVQRYFS